MNSGPPQGVIPGMSAQTCLMTPWSRGSATAQTPTGRPHPIAGGSLIMPDNTMHPQAMHPENGPGTDQQQQTANMLDAAILDLTRRRLSLATNAATMSGRPNALQGHPHHHSNTTNQPHAMVRQPPQFLSSSTLPLPHQNNTNTRFAATLAARQHQLHREQAELQHKQAELDRHRQQLFVTMNDAAATAAVAMNPSGLLGACASPQLNASQHLGSGFNPAAANPVAASQTQISTHQAASAVAPLERKWWVCQICNSKAFLSRADAMKHEAGCSIQADVPMESFGAGAVQNIGVTQTQPQLEKPSFQNLSNVGHPSLMLHVPNMVPTPEPTSATTTNKGMAFNNANPGGNQGPFTSLQEPLPLALESDKDWLTPLHCFVRKRCVELFCATTQDVMTPNKGKRKPIHLGQVGIRCPFCQGERGSVYYPTTTSSIYDATLNLLQRHLHACPRVPQHITKRYMELKADDARSGTSKKYWVESAMALGLVDTPHGIRVSCSRSSRPIRAGLSPTSLKRDSSDQLRKAQSKRSKFEGMNSPQSRARVLAKMNQSSHQSNGSLDKDGTNSPSNKRSQIRDDVPGPPLVTESDKPYATTFSFHLLSQMQPCVFTEADRLGKRKGLPAGFAGLACRHCFGGYGSGRFFPSSIKTLSDTSKTLNVLHNHMMRCRKCPMEVRDQLEHSRTYHDEERSKMKFGSQKAFFAKIWARLHENQDSPPSSPKKDSTGNSANNGGTSLPPSEQRLSQNATTVALQTSGLADSNSSGDANASQSHQSTKNGSGAQAPKTIENDNPNIENDNPLPPTSALIGALGVLSAHASSSQPLETPSDNSSSTNDSTSQSNKRAEDTIPAEQECR
eukprot:CAMPEP_0118720512 /NCGR_PEP_ID=MMETSP0800-20121206/30150_1 /TAXON_ID=210618 ORGANISM="Striatella unipunctata, Strain CCMP2910" /NCGR_SAMPLE_ID=MMETSP0800 /ASSEMBLY_ACC=CAM_ASM_000638 /LENGTH=849 /DNA_ID=CAMNT_0006628157 /DNA_START=179 /DNA_END=2728 /DNA_ORIENTATION=+